MRKIGILLFCFAILLSFRAAFAEKRESYQYDEGSGTHVVKEDWFGRAGKNRKKMEETKRKEIDNAFREENIKRKAMIESAYGDQELDPRANRRIKPDRPTSEEEKLRSDVKSGLRSNEFRHADDRRIQRIKSEQNDEKTTSGEK